MYYNNVQRFGPTLCTIIMFSVFLKETQQAVVGITKGEVNNTRKLSALTYSPRLTSTGITILKKLSTLTDFVAVPDQNGISQACYIAEIHHSGLEPTN